MVDMEVGKGGGGGERGRGGVQREMRAGRRGGSRRDRV